VRLAEATYTKFHFIKRFVGLDRTGLEKGDFDILEDVVVALETGRATAASGFALEGLGASTQFGLRGLSTYVLSKGGYANL